MLHWFHKRLEVNVKNPREKRCFQAIIVFSFGSVDNSKKCTVLWKIAARLITVSTSVNNEMWVKLSPEGRGFSGSHVSRVRGRTPRPFGCPGPVLRPTYGGPNQAGNGLAVLRSVSRRVLGPRRGGRLQPGLPRECLWPIALLYLPTLVQSRAFGSFNLQGTRLLPTAIPYAAMSETSSNRWNLSVISDFSFSA